MTDMTHDHRPQPSSPRVCFPARRASEMSGHRLPNRLTQSVQQLVVEPLAGLSAARGSRFEACSLARF
ncbi:hypothetical protein [Aureimonas mangrovi]|uniref:hypothetical protein n=1 Tax=Aureimonas mangrovi TaxID=2758041 RepID=UPI00163D5871|nr:hypothetical protein [Aureimonas mangrovi]